MLETKFQADLKKDLYDLFPGCIVLKNDEQQIQGFPDLLILYKNKWAALECKRSCSEYFQPNQEYYLEMLDAMSYASAIFPENKEEVLDELQHTFAVRGSTRVSIR